MEVDIWVAGEEVSNELRFMRGEIVEDDVDLLAFRLGAGDLLKEEMGDIGLAAIDLAERIPTAIQRLR